MRKWLITCITLLLLCAVGARAQEPPKQQSESGQLTRDCRAQHDPSKPRADRLQQDSLLLLIGCINGEFVKVQPKQSLLCDQGKVVHLKVEELPKVDAKKSENLNEGSIRVVSKKGCQTGSGGTLQIVGQSLGTGLAIDVDKGTIRIDLNGGTGKKKGAWKDHVQIGVGGAGGGRTVPLGQKTTQPKSDPINDPPGLIIAAATIAVEFNGPIPDITPEDLKHILLPLLAFADKRSAAVQWIDSIDPKFKAAIEKKEIIVGMDKDMVLAIYHDKPSDCGQTACMQREKNDQGVEVETWMYGGPPNTLFIYFIDGKVDHINKPGFVQNNS